MSRKTPLLLVSCLLSAGCSAVATQRLPAAEFPSTGRVVCLGTFYDLRERSTPEAAPSDVEAPVVDQREVRIPVAEIRSVLADSLTRAGLFAGVLNPPAPFTGDTPERMVHTAQQSSDFLLVGEVTQFHVKSIGFNGYAALSIPLDSVFSAVSLVTFVVTSGHSFLFSGALIGCWSAEAVLTLSVSLIDTETGRVVHTVRLEERVQSPYDGTDAFGAWWDDSDDWIDLGRRLGETALHNAGVHLAERLHAARQALTPDRGRQTGAAPKASRRP